MKSNLKWPYDKQNLVFISYEIYETRQRLGFGSNDTVARRTDKESIWW